MSGKYFQAYPNKIRLSLMSYNDHSETNIYQWSCDDEHNTWIFEGMILNDQVIAKNNPQYVKPIYKYIITGGCAENSIDDCSTPPEPPGPTPSEPEVISITLTPNDTSACIGSDVSGLSYTPSKTLKTGDVVENDSTKVVGNVISFVTTPTIQSADPSSYTYEVTPGTGTITWINCLEIDPQCPSVCIPSNSQMTTEAISGMIGENSNFEPNRLLNENESIKTRDSIKSLSFDVTVNNL